MYKFSGSRFFRVGSLQALLRSPFDRAMLLTAFPIHLGLMEFTRLSFGLVTACATYIKLMIRTHGLALKISKCHFGFPGLDWPLLCCPGFTLYLLPGAVNESASSVGEISVPLALTCSGGILVVRAGWCAKYPFCCCYIVYTYVFLQV
ncbi:uncharacterized protein LOC123511409 isoform X2 [Portunus trituberculatus]|uniref:uncharacterized protein LOC123511409 isoform X2 n=1 Tax=Portunus trituberculatus TaxID=210409 RepID=UPI001E1CDD97|nr:uncharacterized protein LOC123511409 isoform X2 [Portunus trituberculatus]